MNRVYRKVLDYVTDAGFIQKLRAHMRVEEKDHFGARDISKSGLAILDAVHCIHDSKRTNAFLKEIAANTRADSVVIEAGIGTGILSFFAATRAKKVYGVEINRHICALANNIQKYLLAENIMPQPVKIYRADATRVRFPEKADVIINENIYTGLFFEKQIQIATHLRKYLKRGGVMIPEALHSYVVLC
jgi:predicted RNA methylase